MKQSLGEYIRNMRTAEGLTLTQLGAKLEIDSANLSIIENGKRDFDKRKFDLLAEVYDLNLDKLKTEYYDEFIAKKIYSNNCSTDAFYVVEEKLKYLRQQDVKQGKIIF